MAHLRLFAQAREIAGTSSVEISGNTVEEVLQAGVVRYGLRFSQILDICRVWLNGEPCQLTDAVSEDDEVAVLPPVSGGL